MTEPAPTQKLLFICTKNQVRSLTAEKLFADSKQFTVRSAGTRSDARIAVTEAHLAWADIIVCMERWHFSQLREKFPTGMKGKRVVCLHIIDEYYFMQRELVEEIHRQLGQHLEIGT